ncbi:MAG: hypothetical protein ACR2P0_18030 [Acidimicrobiales bacterium]
MQESHRTIAQVSVAVVISLVLVRVVHGRAGDETLVCDVGRCTLGSGASWLLTGAAIAIPLIGLAGFRWSRRLDRRGRLGPFARRAIPDGEELFEGLAVIAAALVSWWLIRNGPSLIAVDVGFPNDTVGERVVTASGGRDRVPARRTWFLVGILLAAPFAFSLGSMIGREWYGRARRRAERDDEGDQADAPTGRARSDHADTNAAGLLDPIEESADDLDDLVIDDLETFSLESLDYDEN